MKDLKNRNALVTGSSRGVGQQIVKGLAALGCNIMVHGRTQDSCQRTLEILKDYDVQTYCVHGDLSDPQQLEALIDQVNALGVTVDILYNNAAIMRPYREDIWTHTYEDWMTTYQVNVFAMYKLCSAFIPAMIEKNFGRVVNTTSRIMNQPELAPYGASKWAVDKLSMDIAHSLENTNVRLNYFDPGWLKTDMGGAHAEHPVEDVLPGALMPALVDDDGPNGQFFSAVDYIGKDVNIP